MLRGKWYSMILSPYNTNYNGNMWYTTSPNMFLWYTIIQDLYRIPPTKMPLPGYWRPVPRSALRPGPKSPGQNSPEKIDRISTLKHHKCGENLGNFMGKVWKTMGKPWETYGKSRRRVRKAGEKYGKKHA